MSTANKLFTTPTSLVSSSLDLWDTSQTISFRSPIPMASSGFGRTVRGARAPVVRDSLAAIHKIPSEILQGAFSFAILHDGNSTRKFHRTLHAICSVNKQWRDAAVTHPALWTSLPVADFEDAKQTKKYRQRIIDALALYINRSRPLPISFTLRVNPTAKDGDEFPSDTTLAVTQLLVRQSHRWYEVELRFSNNLYPYLTPIQGRLAVLTRVKVEMPMLNLRNRVFDIFSEAPRLRKVELFIHWCSPAGVSLVFPWSQLGEFACSTKSDKLEAYHLLLNSRPTSLRTLEYHSRSLALLPTSVSIPLPQLEKLVLRISNDFKCDIFSHLDALTLPLLTHLELWGKLLDVTQDPYDVVQGLLERSGCSLRTSFLCLSNNQEATVDNFRKLVGVCPGLETLHLRTPESSILRTLLLKPAANQSSLPNLRTLGLHTHGGRVLDGTDLALIIESRTGALQDQKEPQQFQMLQEVVFVSFANVGVQQAILKDSFIGVLDASVDELSKKTVEEALESFHWSFAEHGAWLSPPEELSSTIPRQDGPRTEES